MKRRRGTVGFTAAALALGLAAAGGSRYRTEARFYAGVARALLMGRRFRARYRHTELDMPFCPRSSARLDVYRPASPSGSHNPVLIFVHGGAWKDYHKELFAPVALRLVPQGIITVIPDYTMYPAARYEQMADEVAGAVDWVLRNCARLGGDPQRVLLAGHSAGGHLIGLVGLDRRFLAGYGQEPAGLAGLIGLSGVYDVNAQRAFNHAKGIATPVMDTVMGGPESFAAASPINHVHADAPPFLLIHGARDEVVPASLSRDFHGALASSGAHSTLKMYPDAGHNDYLFAAMMRPEAQVLGDLVEFVREGARRNV